MNRLEVILDVPCEGSWSCRNAQEDKALSPSDARVRWVF